ncbi:MAG TPA: hypothetical protein ACFYD6_14890, partial [Candidatus Brocadiia bacterium]
MADQGGGLQIIDVTDPASSTLLGSYYTPGVFARDVYVLGNVAYVADGGSGLQIIDVANPSAPTLLGSYNANGGAQSVCVSGSTAYVAGDDLQIINVSNPSSPTLLGSYDTPGYAWGVYVLGSTAYVAVTDFVDLSGLQIINVTDPASPTLLGSYNTPDVWASAVYVSGTTAYVTGGRYWGGKLDIIDVSNPASPLLLGRFEGLTDMAWDVYVSGRTAYVAINGAWGHGGVDIIDVSNPQNPSLLGSYGTLWGSYGFYVSGGTAYVAEYYGWSGLEIIDVSGCRRIEDCVNGIDDDNDGLVDCDDPECCDDPVCFDTQICSGITEDLLAEEATMNDVEVSGDFTSTLNFTNFELVRITTGAFAGKGFSKGECETTLDGISYTGEWKGALFLKPQEKKIYLKGAITGEISATVEGYLTESIPDSGVYDKYYATWQVGKLGGAVASFTLNLNGTLSYQGETPYNGTHLYLLQANVETTDNGHYGGDLNTVLTHLRVVSEGNPYVGEGFSIMSYNSASGAGQGWTYDRLLTQGIVRMEGLFSSPLYGIATATLDDSTLTKTLSLRIERVDKGKPPAPDLRVRTWGPERVSPGQTVDYIIEYRNDGTKAAEDVDVNMKLPLAVGYVSNTGEASYNRESHEVVWHLGNVSPKSKGLVSTKETISWGLFGHTFIENVVFIPIEKEEVYVDPSVNVNPNTIEETDNYAKIIGTISNSSVSENFYLEISITEVPEEIEPVLNIVETQDGEEYHWKFTGKGHSTDYVDITLKTTKEGRKIVDTFKEGADAMEAKNEHQAFLDALLNEGLINEATHKEHTKWNDFRPVIPLFRYLMGKLPKVGWIEGLFPKGTPLGTMSANNFLWEEIRRNYFAKINTGSPVFGIPSGDLPNVDTMTLDGLYELFKRKGSHGTSLGKSEVFTAGDPNIKYGPSGAVVAGQKLTYKVEFENEGEGIAFGVYFTDTLDEDLDDTPGTSLVIGKVYDVDTDEEIGPVGTYDPATRTITWFVGNGGEVGPGKGGYAELSVKVKSGAANGTEIINYSTVYFPSVPEETRTNAIVSIIPLIEVCDDGIDNDEDGLTDCEDPECSGQACEEVCDDGMDNDGDSFVDCADTDCPPCPEDCDDGLDNDRDELVDCDDPDCDCPEDCTDATYSKGLSSISFKGGNRDKANLRMCVNQDFCDALKAGVEEIVLKLDDCNEITIPGNKLKAANKKKTKFTALSA